VCSRQQLQGLGAAGSALEVADSGQGQGPRLHVGAGIPAEGGCSTSPELSLQQLWLPAAAAGLGWAGLPGKICMSGRPWQATGDDAESGLGSPAWGKVIATPRREAQRGLAAITCASAVISVLLVPFLTACRE